MRVQEDPKEAARDHPWIHTSFSNLKRVQCGTHAYTSAGNNRPYLDAFEYRHNHRNHLGDGFKRALKAMFGEVLEDRVASGEGGWMITDTAREAV